MKSLLTSSEDSTDGERGVLAVAMNGAGQAKRVSLPVK